MTSHEEKRDAISDAIRVIPDFPKKGILFQDVTTILLDPLAFQYCVDLLVDHYKSQKIDVIAGTHESFLLLFGLTRTPHSSCGLQVSRPEGSSLEHRLLWLYRCLLYLSESQESCQVGD